MAEITAGMVRDLRQATGVGMMDCKRALSEAGGDMDKATQLLREKGLAQADKRAGRQTAEGIIDSYIHLGGRIGVLVEVNCETDFVARNEEFVSFVHDLALQIAASNPVYVSRDQVPDQERDAEMELLRAQAREEGKPDHIIPLMVEGRMDKFYERICLLDQPFVRDSDIKVGDLLKETIAKMGENLRVSRFVRFEVGQED